jgi:hypothetical protein
VTQVIHQRGSALLAALATLGLVVAPVIHAEVHLREQARAHEQAVELLFRIAFERGELPDRDALEKLAAAEAFGGKGERPGLSSPSHQHEGHSHGPGAMASGALEHFGAVIHPPPPAPQVVEPARVAVGAPVAPAPLLLSPHYSTPKHSQAPPAA